jgi:hemerythrin-like domain-containing protein
MNSIDIMIHEHTYIKRMLKIVQKLSQKIVDGKAVEHQAFYQAIDFVRNYADKYHHGKEEDMLFKDMAEELGDVMKTGPIQGMLIEHDLGRMYIANLEENLKKHENGEDTRIFIIANAVSYTELLFKHIDKEDNAIYQYAKRTLKKETLEKLDRQSDEFESEASNIEKRKKYTSLVDEFEKKYL